MSKTKSNGLPQIIKFARMKAGMRQMDLATLLGISENEMSKIETGRRGMSAALYVELQKHLALPDRSEFHGSIDHHKPGCSHG